MNRGILSRYAPEARRKFIQAVTDRAGVIGLSERGNEPIQVEGDVAMIAGRPFLRRVAGQRAKLEERIQLKDFSQVMEEVAYTWFNRFAALRFMELHGYLDHGYRVLSHPEGRRLPQIVAHAEKLDLPGLNKDKVIELKLDGTKDEELYRLILKAECNALHRSMPFLFEAIDDATEILLPDNLLSTGSILREMVEVIPEEDWQEIEIIGWLYQFYISEKKDQVIGKVVASEDIPAATQLFTPNWIVKYMVQNSLGAQWLATYPESKLKEQMDYYIDPAEQTDEVKAQLAASTPSTLNPEELTLIDPASGSGHILTEAYELFKAIYLERGYRQRDVAQVILEKNLFGLDIDLRAAQLTGFALMMKGRADDRRLFERGVKLNVMALVDSAEFDAERLVQGVKLADYALQPSDLTELKRLFEHATTFGSLIQVTEGLSAKLPALKQLSEATSQDLFIAKALEQLGPLVQQAGMLAAQYDAVVANPPYMGSRHMNAMLKKFAKDHFTNAKSDLFACFIERGYTLAKDAGHNAMVTMQSWMFLSSFEKMRELLLQEKTIGTMAHLGARAFGSISGEIVQTTTFSLRNLSMNGYKPVFFRLLDGGEEEKKSALRNGEKRFDTTAQDEFKKIPGSPLAYWVGERIRDVFDEGSPLESIAPVRQGMATGDNDTYLRAWSEVDVSKSSYRCGSKAEAFSSGTRWFPYNKGGAYRKWNGNKEFVVRFDRPTYEVLRTVGNNCPSENFYFLPAVTWSFISSSYFGVRQSEQGFVFDVAGSSCFPPAELMSTVTGFLCSKLPTAFLGATNPTINFQAGNIRSLPILESVKHLGVDSVVVCLVGMAKSDWDAYERSWDFQSLPLLTASSDPTPTLESSYTAWVTQNRETIAEMRRLEEENNRLFIDAYGLGEELTPDVPLEQITLTVNPAYRYGGKLTEEEQWTRFRQDTMEELVSYAIGCMMGRYSLDAPGLIYARSGNEDFDPSRYTTFPADDDGIVPLTDTEWFDDDATLRFIEFLGRAWPKEHLDENLEFVAKSLGKKATETPGETIRKYLTKNFFKGHLQTYKKRPIYWLFSSGKEKAFECLVYLHRYNESTLSRMRMEYVTPLQRKLSGRIEQLDDEIENATSTSHKKKLEKERETLTLKRTELAEYDDKLRHYADQRISLDLDDGVKVNYGKFGDLLAEVKAVTGKK